VRITSLTVYTAPLRYAGEAYAFAGGRSYAAFTSAVVALATDAGLTGWGEVCPCGPSYTPAFAAGLVPCLTELAPAVLGRDPREVAAVGRAMDRALAGQADAKAAVDAACWDLLGKAAGLPVYVLLGGRLAESIPLHRIVPLAAPADMARGLDDLRAAGFANFQVKLGRGVAEDLALVRALTAGGRPGERFVGDANGAWRRDEALRFANAAGGLDLYLEQPCATYAECLAVRRRCRLPLKLDESLATVADVRRALADDAMDAAALKLSRLGGLTKARVARDLCADAGIPVTIEDAWGSGIATAAFAHLAASTPPERLLDATDLHAYNTTQLARGAPEVADGRMTVSDRPGLGVEPDLDALGDPVAVRSA